jgi:hypothetical protein
MSRYDKYEPHSGGFRAALAGAWTGSAAPIGVGLDVNGRVVAGAGQSGIVGILCKPDDAAALAIVDVMTSGEIVEFTTGAAGTAYTALTTTGAIGTTAPDATHKMVGFTVEADRLVVRVPRAA